jgi:CheY-like chemotaxis protein
MSQVLLIVDDRHAESSVGEALAALAIAPICLPLEDFDADYLLAEMFDLIVIELFGETLTCIALLQQFEKLAATSGVDHPPIIVITGSDTNPIEQALRTAKVSFILQKPLDRNDLISAIRQVLHLTAP